MRYKIAIHYETEVEAANKEDAEMDFMVDIEQGQPFSTWIGEHLELTEIKDRKEIEQEEIRKEIEGK